jgi:thiamine biosynthesis protein ThiS
MGNGEALRMRIFFNGEPQEVDDDTTVATLLSQLGLQPRYVAVEVNLELVPRQCHETHLLKAGDRLEVVTLVGGG